MPFSVGDLYNDILSGWFSPAEAVYIQQAAPRAVPNFMNMVSPAINYSMPPMQRAFGQLGTTIQNAVQPVINRTNIFNGQSNSQVPAELQPHFVTAAQTHGVPQRLLEAMAFQESGYNPNIRSRAGAQGVMQLMPDTARELGVTNPLDPAQNIDGGARYLRRMLDMFGGDPRLALAAYNAGPGRVRRAGGIPQIPETQNYVNSIMGRLNQ